jgi:carbon catabolite-derepressing protein kinase
MRRQRLSAGSECSPGSITTPLLQHDTMLISIHAGRGRLYAGPEIDIWSCGVILYVMLCGRLPFDDEYIPKLFQKINGGIYHLPSHLSEDARALLKSMLVVDPVKRITTAGIRQSAWFQRDLPQYLQPLPQTPGLERPGQGGGQGEDASGLLGQGGSGVANTVDGTTSAPDDQVNKADADTQNQGLVYVPDLGVVEPRIVDELCEKMAGFDRNSIWDALKREGDNQIKVAYQLVRDHKRMLQDSELLGRIDSQRE